MVTDRDILTAPKPSALSAMEWADRDYRAGYLLAEQVLADEPQPIRAATAREWRRQRDALPVKTPMFNALSGAIRWVNLHRPRGV